MRSLPPTKKTAPKKGSPCAERAKPQPVERRALTIEEFCQAYHISPDHYFKLKRDGKGPREMKLSTKKILITMRAADRWELEREKDTANEERKEEAATNAAAPECEV